jgi:hypothetical protein
MARDGFKQHYPKPFLVIVLSGLHCTLLITTFSRISDVMVRLLASSAVGRGFEPPSGQTKDYEIGICCFTA